MSMVIPRAQTIYVTTPAPTSTVATADQKPFWESSFTLPIVNSQFTLTQAGEAVLGVVVGAYVTSFGYYLVSQALEEQQAEAKKKENLAKMAAKKAAVGETSRPAVAVDEVKAEMVTQEAALEAAPAVEESSESSNRSVLPWKK
jgi:hypothetical protein